MLAICRQVEQRATSIAASPAIGHRQSRPLGAAGCRPTPSAPPRTGCTFLASYVIGLSFGDRRLGEEAWFEAESSISPRSRAIEMRGRSTTVMAAASRSIIQAGTGTVQWSPPRAKSDAGYHHGDCQLLRSGAVGKADGTGRRRLPPAPKSGIMFGWVGRRRGESGRHRLARRYRKAQRRRSATKRDAIGERSEHQAKKYRLGSTEPTMTIYGLKTKRSAGGFRLKP